ncbi:Distal membrane-arm assembly complex protein 2 [Eumeta japonica]|uniref:Distal membrane-arm assembly complex protein 2 n=1 Tax=Eumeta variegata TaxID=151549 RepID=A0A4C1SB62_EUMVA|nr:Distal membrane-arm assembly complex protein 2 [Eumeta japonica]
MQYVFHKYVRNCSEEKSIYQRHEEGPRERTVHGQPYPDWRKPWIQRSGEWYSKLNIFVEKNPNADALYILQKVPDFNLQVAKEWWAEMKELQERQNQRYIPQRVDILGPNLAAMHYFTFRGAAVRLKNENNWISGNPMDLDLPVKFAEGYFIEAIDCSTFKKGGIRYEGIPNLGELNFLKWLSLQNNSHVDEWSLDKLAGQNGSTIEYLDIRGISFNVGCVYALARMPKLQVVLISDISDNLEIQAALSVLEMENPNLLIKVCSEEPPEQEDTRK